MKAVMYPHKTRKGAGLCLICGHPALVRVLLQDGLEVERRTLTRCARHLPRLAKRPWPWLNGHAPKKNETTKA